MAAFSSEDLEMFVRSAARFRESAPGRTPAPTTFSREQWREYAALGWLGLTIPEELGGMGAGAVELGALVQALAPALMVDPLIETLAVCAKLIEHVGSAQQRTELLPAIADGSLLPGLAHDEVGSAFDRHKIQARAKRDGDRYLLTGHKRLSVPADAADIYLVSARADDEIGLFLVTPRDASPERTHRLVDGQTSADVMLDAAPALRLGDGDASAALDQAFDFAALMAATESASLVSTLREATVEFARSRRQFGAAISSFQVVQHRLVDMLTGEQEAKAVARTARRAFDQGHHQAPALVSAAKARIDEIGRFALEQAIQLHGGMGLSDELAVGQMAKRLMLNASRFGNAQWHLARVGARF